MRRTRLRCGSRPRASFDVLVAVGFAVLPFALGVVHARAQPARVSAVVQAAQARDAVAINVAVGAELERHVARCEPLARAARPFDAIEVVVELEADGRVSRTTTHVMPARLVDGAMRTITTAEQRRATSFGACVARAIRRVAFPAGPADTVTIAVSWAATGPAVAPFGRDELGSP